jgi:hypothetical protein
MRKMLRNDDTITVKEDDNSQAPLIIGEDDESPISGSKLELA